MYVKNYDRRAVSTQSKGLMRNTTGTLVHGRIPSSVTTAVTKSGGVTS